MQVTLRKAITIACITAAFNGSSVRADEDMRGTLLDTLDNLEASVVDTPMALLAMQRIEDTRSKVLLASPGELATIPSSVQTDLEVLELSTRQVRLLREKSHAVSPVVEKRSKLSGPGLQSAGADHDDGNLADPSYPDFDWSFAFSYPGEPDGDDDSGCGSDTCDSLGYSVSDRFVTLNAAIVAEAAKDIAERACDLTVAGFNVSLACIVTDVAAYVAIGIERNQELCNELLNTPQGRRPDWPVKP